MFDDIHDCPRLSLQQGRTKAIRGSDYFGLAFPITSSTTKQVQKGASSKHVEEGLMMNRVGITWNYMELLLGTAKYCLRTRSTCHFNSFHVS